MKLCLEDDELGLCLVRHGQVLHAKEHHSLILVFFLAAGTRCELSKLLKLLDKKNQGYCVSESTLRFHVNCWKM